MAGWMRSTFAAGVLVALSVHPAAAGPRIVVDAIFPDRLPAPPPGKLAPAFDATVQVSGRFVGFTVPEGRAVIELPDGGDLGGASGILSNHTLFPTVSSLGGGTNVHEVDDVIVILDPGITTSAVPATIGGFVVKRFHAPGNFAVLDASSGITAFKLQVLRADSRVRFVEPSYRYELHGTSPPNEPDWLADNPGMWGLWRIKAAAAWTGVHDAPLIAVAVIDSGFDLDHVDLAANLWRNQNEVVGVPGHDDDGNGCKDDINGCDFLEGDAPEDTQGHGTQVAGIIGAVGNNGIGTVGVAWSIPLIAVRVFESQWVELPDAVAAIDYAIASGARIMNASWAGRNSHSVALSEAITRANDATPGRLLVAAPGNNGSNLDDPLEGEYPAAYGHQNIVVALNMDDQDGVSGSTGYGAFSVDLGAPGSGILTTSLASTYKPQFGSSFAVPHVTGALALTWAKNPTMTHLAVKQMVLDHVTVVPGLSGHCATRGRLNIEFLAGRELPAPTLKEVTPMR